MNKIETVVDDINGKVTKLNGLFNVIDYTTDKLTLLSDKLVDGISYLIKKVFTKKKKEVRKEDEDE